MERCRTCGGAPFHKLGCPRLTESLRFATLFFVAALVVLTLGWVADWWGRPQYHFGIPITIAAAAAWIASNRRRLE